MLIARYFFVVQTKTPTQLAFQFAVMFNCEYIQFGQENYASLGPWYYGVSGTCESEEFALESEGWFAARYVNASRSCLILSMFCGAAATVMVTFEWLCCQVCCAGVLEGLGFAGGWGCGL
jgi:hypothetical protein